MSGEIVPFGKYKDKPVEVMLADVKYIEWCVQQPWFREKYVNIYTIVTGISSEAAETPEHNALQIKFLDPKFQEIFARFLLSEENKEKMKAWTFSAKVNFEVGHPPIDVTIEGEFQRSRTDKEETEYRNFIMQAHKELFLDMDDYHWESIKEREDRYWIIRGIRDAPTLKYLGCGSLHIPFYKRAVEIKPTLGDDYPAVFRQMKKSGARLLLIGEYTGQGASEEQLRAFFATAEILVILLSELGGGV